MNFKNAVNQQSTEEKVKELVRAILIIGARRGNQEDIDFDTASKLTSQSVNGLTERMMDLINGQSIKSGIELIAAERQEQFEKHKRTIFSDVTYNTEWELSSGAIALLLKDGSYFSPKWDKDICDKMISKPDKERFIIAGALVAAEIDRLQY